MVGVVGQHAHRMAVQARQAGDCRGPVVAADLEDRALVQHHLDDAPGLVDPAALARDDGEQPLLAAFGIIVALLAQRQPVDVLRQVGKEALGLRDGVGLVFGLVIDHARATGVGGKTSQFLLADFLAHAGRHHRRAGGEELGGMLDHDREMSIGHLPGTQPGARAQCHGRHRHLAQKIQHGIGGIAGKLGGALLFQQLDGAAGGVDQAHQRHPHIDGLAFDVDPFFGDGRFRGAAADGEVVGRNQHPPAAHAALADHRIGRAHVDQLARLGIVVARAGEAAQLAEAAFVEELGNAFAGRHLARVVVALDGFLAAQRQGKLTAALDFLDFRLPAHGPMAPPVRRLLPRV